MRIMETDLRKKKVVLSFSGGKDSVLSLYRLLNDNECEVMALLTNLNPNSKILMHGFDSELLDVQGQSIGIMPLHIIVIPKTNEKKSEYAKKMKKTLKQLQENGATHVAYGDIYLEDVRKFREDKLSMIGMKSIFPLWGENTKKIAEEFIELGFKSVITCVNTEYITKEWIGKEFNKEFIAYLVDRGIDPCGENGEFHTFVYSGPIFRIEIKYQIDFENPFIYNEFYGCVAKKHPAFGSCGS